jgi:uroporphyrinogen-III synthase
MDTALPLAAMRVLVTRPAGRGEALAARLRSLGAEPIVRPTIAYAPPDDAAALDDALGRLAAGVYEWLLLTSAHAVAVVAGGLGDLAPRLGQRVSLKIGAVGPATAAACRDLLRVEPAALPERFVGEALATAIGDPAGRRVLLPNAEDARPHLEERLRAAGALVERVVAYRTVPATEGADLAALLADGGLDALLFASGSAARCFAQLAGAEGLERARHLTVVCLGPVTAEACRALGLEPAAIADEATEDALVEALVKIRTEK